MFKAIAKNERGRGQNPRPSKTVRDAAAKHNINITVRPAIGESDGMIEALADWAIDEPNTQTQ